MLLAFLGIVTDGRTDFPIVNENKQIRSHPLKRILEEVAELKRYLGIKRGFGLQEKMKHSNLKVAKRKPLCTEFRRELVAYFADDVRKLEQATQRDLSAWLNVTD